DRRNDGNIAEEIKLSSLIAIQQKQKEKAEYLQMKQQTKTGQEKWTLSSESKKMPSPHSNANGNAKVLDIVAHSLIKRVPYPVPFELALLYSFPLTDVILYLKQTLQNEILAETVAETNTQKCCEKYLYLYRIHHPQLLYWISLETLLESKRFDFLQMGLNCELVGNSFHFHQFSDSSKNAISKKNKPLVFTQQWNRISPTLTKSYDTLCLLSKQACVANYIHCK
ncbi:hypothetical protein RFI_17165, partial [Reticulomyxa filosa]